MAFKFERTPYGSIEEWAAQRGQQIRQAFGIGLDVLRPEGAGKPSAMQDVEWNAAKVALLMPAYRDRFAAFLAEVEIVGEARGVDFIVWDAVRSLERHLDLYKRGRVDKGAKVTHTIASNHLGGCAVDLCVRLPNGQPSWDLPGWYNKGVLPLAAKHGLESLYLVSRIDLPHIQVPATEQPAELREMARALKADFPGLAL